MRASVVSVPCRSASTSRAPSPFTVPAKTSSPGIFSTGTDSPVTADWSTADAPRRTRPSTAILSPGRTITTSPGTTSSTATVTSAPPRRSRAMRGARSTRALIAPRARSRARSSSTSERL